jgi:hypothetical protein
MVHENREDCCKREQTKAMEQTNRAAIQCRAAATAEPKLRRRKVELIKLQLERLKGEPEYLKN